MTRNGKNVLWIVLVLWGLMLWSWADAHSEESPKTANTVTISSADSQSLLTAWDKMQADVKMAQDSIAKYQDFRKKINSKYKLDEATEYSVGLADCKKISGGDLQCKRSITPIPPKVKVGVEGKPPVEEKK